MVQTQVRTNLHCTIKNVHDWKDFITQRPNCFPEKPVLLIIPMKHTCYIQEILYINLGKWNMTLFARYSHKLIITVFIITKFYYINTACKEGTNPAHFIQTWLWLATLDLTHIIINNAVSFQLSISSKCFLFTFSRKVQFNQLTCLKTSNRANYSQALNNHKTNYSEKQIT